MKVATYWTPICEAAGFDVSEMNVFDLFLLAGRIMHDQTVGARHVERGNIIGNDYPLTLKAMSEGERAELRQRIQGKKPVTGL